MRPYSPIRADLAAALLDGPGTTRQLAQRTGWAIGITRETLNNMVRAGDADKPRELAVRVPGVRRPVPVYVRAERDTGRPADNTPMQTLIQAWMGSAIATRQAHCAKGAAM